MIETHKPATTFADHLFFDCFLDFLSTSVINGEATFVFDPYCVFG